MRILIVDDDMAIVEAIRDTVNWDKLGIAEVETAYGAGRAKKILEEKPVDIVISDIEMPKETGLELLRWYREENMDGEFLLLTCHENFHYATEALKLQAAEYLVKPFNVEIMELVLQKIIRKRKRELEAARDSEYGKWIRDNPGEVRLLFWSNLFGGRLVHARAELVRELQRRKLELDMEKQYRLVISKSTNMEQDIDMYGRSMLLFIFENLHSELLCGKPENDSVVCYEHRDSCVFITVCEDGPEGERKEKCRELIQKCGRLLSSTLTCYISNPCTIPEFYDVFHKSEEILAKNIMFYGEAFAEIETTCSEPENQPVLQLKQLQKLLEEKDENGFLNYLKKELDGKTKQKLLDEEMLKRIRAEVQQAVYAYLAQRGIQISLLLGDAAFAQLAEKAGQSVIDMLRWEKYLLERVFAYEEEVQKSQTLIEKINAYIREHYSENIGRNEIGAAFFLVPEYLAKMYKKKTGQNLKDFINEYRLSQAKRLLKNSDMKVSDVAMEVGFDNFSYFSTLFKQHTGMTPNEYRKN